jgi:hypothetical protein
MPTDRAALSRPADDALARWRIEQETQSLRDMVTTYRTGATALAVRVSELRAEVARLNAALRADRDSRGVATIELPLALDAHTPELVGTILSAEFAGLLPPQVLEDAQLVACELAAGSVRRCSGSSDAEAMVRVERAEGCLRVSLEDRAGPRGVAVAAPEDPRIDEPGLSIVERLSARWGIERTSSGSTTVWAELALDADPVR